MRTVRALTCILIAALAVTLIVGCGSNSDAKRNAAFSAKIAELESAYGTGEVVEDGRTYITGLAYAEMVDFGNGNQKLVTAYLDESSMKYQMPLPSDYVVEVWDWGKGNQELSSFQLPSCTSSPGGCAWIPYYASDSKVAIAVDHYYHPGEDLTVSNTLYGASENGAFGSVIASETSTTINPYTPQASSEFDYVVSDNPSDSDTYQSTKAQYSSTIDVYLIGDPTTPPVASTLERVAMTKRVLQGEAALGGTYTLDSSKDTKLVVSDKAWAVIKDSEILTWGKVAQFNNESIKPSDDSVYNMDYLFLTSEDGTLHMLSKSGDSYELSAAKHILDGNPSLAADGTYSKNDNKVNNDGIKALNSLREYSTPYYTITLPQSESAPFFYCDSTDLRIAEPESAQLGIGCETRVDLDWNGAADFSVACFTDNWGPQGMFYTHRLGPVNGQEGWSVWVYQTMDRNGSDVDMTGEYAKYITLK